MTAKNNII